MKQSSEFMTIVDRAHYIAGANGIRPVTSIDLLAAALLHSKIQILLRSSEVDFGLVRHAAENQVSRLTRDRNDLAQTTLASDADHFGGILNSAKFHAENMNQEEADSALMVYAMLARPASLAGSLLLKHGLTTALVENWILFERELISGHKQLQPWRDYLVY